MSFSNSKNLTSFSGGHALIIGTGTDIDGDLSSRFKSTINDAELIAEVLREPTLCAFPECQVKVLVGQDATRERIVTELDLLEDKLKSNHNGSTIVVFFSGHGQRSQEKTYLLPYGYTNEPLSTHAISGELLYSKLRLIAADKVLLLLNTCYSGGVMPKLGGDHDQPRGFRDLLNEDQIKRLSKGSGFGFLYSSQSSQESRTGYLSKSLDRKRYSPFTIGLAGGFSGKVKKKSNGLVYFCDLVTACTLYVSKKTNGNQIPDFDFKGDNFAVGLHKIELEGWRKLPQLGEGMVFDIETESDANEEEDGEHEEKKQPETRSPISNDVNVNNAYGFAFVGNVSFGENSKFSNNVNT